MLYLAFLPFYTCKRLVSPGINFSQITFTIDIFFLLINTIMKKVLNLSSPADNEGIWGKHIRVQIVPGI